MLLEIIIATLIISLISLVGVVISYKHIRRFLHYFISFAAGTLLAVSFFDLMPHALEESAIDVEFGGLLIVTGIIIFFLVERFIHWHHCDKEQCEERTTGLLILTGDFVHNFLDGVLIAGAFMLDFTTGLVTTVTVAIHEIPQEFGDFAVLIHSGFNKAKALMLNFLSALSAVIGGILGYFMFNKVEMITPFAVLITSGGFIYIALTDIVPSMHNHSKDRSVLFIETIIFVVTIIAFYFFLGMLHHH